MDRHALEHALRQAAVPPTHYWIEGVHEPSPTPTDFLYVREDPGGGWERGVRARYPQVDRSASHRWALPAPICGNC
ncbi:hypothetical protein [Streptomyces sp. NPDC056982]|uniref:hypothetical protein n=1 Tax=Streptomyces sp. NPDC056982 TaxID=3345986 RepID=UPI00362D5E16